MQTAVSSTIGAVKLQLLSDLHLESNPHFTATPTPGADALVLAGDIGSYQPGSRLTTLNIPDFGLGRLCLKPLPVPMLMVIQACRPRKYCADRYK